MVLCGTTSYLLWQKCLDLSSYEVIVTEITYMMSASVLVWRHFDHNNWASASLVICDRLLAVNVLDTHTHT